MNYLTACKIRYYGKVLDELDKLEHLSVEYSKELRYLSKRIRCDIWDNNSKCLWLFLSRINQVFKDRYELIGEDKFQLSTVIQYVVYLSKYSIFYNPLLNVAYFNRLINDIHMESARYQIEEQWKDIYYSENGYKSFIEIFDDIFTECINLYKDKFFHKLKDTDILCRVVSGWKHSTDRFIPWPARTNNRWNPIGKEFLYLSFGEEEEKYSDQLSLNECICLEEYRAIKDEKYSFCYFKPIKEGNILDLSYNDVSFGKLKEIVNTYQDSMTHDMIEKLLSNPGAYEKYKNKKVLKKDIKKLMQINPVDKSILEESYAKQYLKMICNCIYKKVDEKDELKKEIAYKSFHILAEYLESKEVTGIIYPCTRTKKIVGKNLVLFNKMDATPIASSIREIICLEEMQ